MPSCDTNRSDPHFSSRNPTLYKHSLSYQVLLFGQWSIFSAKKSASSLCASAYSWILGFEVMEMRMARAQCFRTGNVRTKFA